MGVGRRVLLGGVVLDGDDVDCGHDVLKGDVVPLVVAVLFVVPVGAGTRAAMDATAFVIGVDQMRDIFL